MSKSRAGSATPATFATVTAITITAGGTGYAVNDVVRLDVPGAVFPPLIKVATLSGSAIATATILAGGRVPTDTTGAQPTTKISGAGSGATITPTLTNRGA